MKLTERANAGLHTHVEETIQRLSVNLNAQVLDVGAGTGAFLRRLQTRGFTSLQGIDIAAPAEPLVGIKVHEFDLDSGKMPFADGSFPLVVSIEVFEHIESLGLLLQEISRVLSPDGTLIITTPNIHSLEARLRFLLLGKLKQFDELSDPTHIYPIALFPFQRLLKRHDLEIVDTWGYPTDGSSPTSRGGLRLAAKALRWLGLKSQVAGDHLCLRIRHMRQSERAMQAPAVSKREAITSHY